MSQRQGSDLLLEILKRHGVKAIFGNPGTTELPLMDALVGEMDLKYVLALQEGAVIGMADGYARASGGLSVASVHAAPGLGAAMGMLYNAYRAGTPLLVIAGQQALGFGLTEPTLAADLPPIAQPFVKWSTEVTRTEDLPRILHRAIKVALSPPTGPVFLSIPTNVLENSTSIEIGQPTVVAGNFRADPESVSSAAEIIKKAQRPVIIAGDAVAQTGAQQELVRIAELIGAEVYIEGEASTNAFPTRHPLFRDSIVRLAPEIRRVLERHDVMLSVGADLFTLSLPSPVNPIPDNLRIVHLDIDPWQLGKNFSTDVAVLGSPKTTLPDLEAALRGTMSATASKDANDRVIEVTSRRQEETRSLVEKAKSVSEASPIEALALNYQLAELLPQGTILIDESISSGVGLRHFLKEDKEDSFHGLRGGGIGWGIPAAIGAKFAFPDRPVVALVGDGSAMYTIQALWTASRFKLDVIFIILANRSYRILKQRLKASGGRAAQSNQYVAMDLDDPFIGYVDIAKGMGVNGRAVTALDEFRDVMHEAVGKGGPWLIEVAIA